MMLREKIKNFLLVVFVVASLVSCDPWFSFSPYEANLDEIYYGTTGKNLAKIDAMDSHDSGPFKIAVFSDPHYHYSKLSDALDYINRSSEYDFVIVAGDLTENGLMQEFKFFYGGMEKLKIPYLTVIGNHDYLANGEKVYSQMFGLFNDSFVYNRVKFVMFDNTTFESQKDPDMDWLAAELVNRDGYDHVIPVSHIPPYDRQMQNHYQLYHTLMKQNSISVSLHGHKHEFSINESFGDSVDYVTVSSPQHRAFTELTITPDAIGIRKIEY